MVEAIHNGHVESLMRLLAENPGLAAARLGDDDPDGMSRTPDDIEAPAEIGRSMIWIFP